MLCDHLEGRVRREGGGRLKSQGTYAYVQLVHIVVQQKLTQHWKAIILQLKEKKNGRELSKWIQGCIKEKKDATTGNTLPALG